MNAQTEVNMLYDALGKVELVLMVMKAEGMNLEDIEKVKKALTEKVKEKGLY